MGRLNGKTALVTAAAQGIGRASALAMAAEGARVIATDVNRDALADLAGEGIETRFLDVRDPAGIAEMVAALPGPDILFNCAGVVANGTILECSDTDWDFSVSLNMTAMFHMCRAFLPGMIANGGGSIINVASVASSVIAAPNRFAYGATKAGLEGFTRHAPYNRILVDGAVEKVPTALLDQLADKGMLVAPVGTGHTQTLVRISRDGRLFHRVELGKIRQFPLREGVARRL